MRSLLRSSLVRPAKDGSLTTVTALAVLLEAQGCVAHEDAAEGLGHRAVGAEAGDDVLRARDRLSRQQDALGNVEALEGARRQVDFAVDPDLAVVVDRCLE